MSAPRSKRDEASVLRPRRLLVRRTDAGLKYALSNATVLVAADTSEDAPPITPATAWARVASAMTSMSGSSVRLAAVERRDRLAGARATDADLAPGQPGEIKGVHRLAELDEHVVRDVHDRADRANADRKQPRREPRGGGADRHVRHRRRISRAELGIVDGDLQPVRFTERRRFQRDLRPGGQ